LRSAVLYIAFNRPNLVRKSFPEIERARPDKLYIAIDGPRANNAEDELRCNEVKELLAHISWDCDVKRLYQEKNLGPGLGPASAINWFFSAEIEGIVLEDDVVPLPSFFDYCDELLEFYRLDSAVGCIGGGNLLANSFSCDHSYLFSSYASIWGWASWRRAWQHYSFSLADENKASRNFFLKFFFHEKYFVQLYWRIIFNSIAAELGGRFWDYQWNYACWKNGMLTIIPNCNQTLNIGFGGLATNTVGPPPEFLDKSAPKKMEFPLIHPDHVAINLNFDSVVERKIFGINWKTVFKSIVKQNIRKFFK
jgi:hypothetical protein